jgi:hypothetical protein
MFYSKRVLYKLTMHANTSISITVYPFLSGTKLTCLHSHLQITHLLWKTFISVDWLYLGPVLYGSVSWSMYLFYTYINACLIKSDYCPPKCNIGLPNGLSKFCPYYEHCMCYYEFCQSTNVKQLKYISFKHNYMHLFLPLSMQIFHIAVTGM